MIAAVRQVTSDLENRFEVSSNGRVVCTAQTPWLSLSVPVGMEHFRRLTLWDGAGKTLFTTAYHVVDNLLEEAAPLKFLTGGGQRFCRYEILGPQGCAGAFYTRQDGFLDTKFCLEYRGKVLLGYDVDRGKVNVVSICDGSRQIAQITKPLAVLDNLDLYYLHIAEEFDDLLLLLAFFVVYYDYRKYGGGGRLTKKSARLSWSWTYDKNNRFYDPNWIAGQFGEEAARQLEQEIAGHRAAAAAVIRHNAKTVGLCFLIGVPVTLGLLLLFLSERGLL